MNTPPTQPGRNPESGQQHRHDEGDRGGQVRGQDKKESEKEGRDAGGSPPKKKTKTEGEENKPGPDSK